jgi:hypothetical protein
MTATGLLSSKENYVNCRRRIFLTFLSHPALSARGSYDHGFLCSSSFIFLIEKQLMTLAIAVRNNPIPKYGVTLSVTIDMIMQVIAAKAKMILAAIMSVFFVFFIFLSLLF